MASIIPGYECDIFISYRQNDNRSGWVTEFIEALQEELSATLKEPVSVYFDTNPHNGLLETHNVDKSLADKLRCLIFIPVISQTYCDLKSFAWQNEFVAFNKIAGEDTLGRDIRLTSGNIASRILPVKINELDQEDKTLLENEIGGILRSIDFIYKSAGVNRPLRANEDHPQDNLNKTYYRDQINKVANAVKEIIVAIKKHNQADGQVPKEIVNSTLNPKYLKKKIISGLVVLIALGIFGYLLIAGLHKSSRSIEKTIAVLPFRNLSNDSTQIYFCEGFTEELLNDLQRIREFSVRSRTSTNQYRKTDKSTKKIGEEMNVNYLIEGSVERVDNKLKIWVQLINAKTDEHIWANDYDRELKQIFSLQSEIAKEIANELETILSPEEKKLIDKKPTENLEAYNYFLKGNDYYWRGIELQDFNIASEMYRKAIELDPKFAKAYIRLSICYLSLYWFYYDHTSEILEKGKQAINRALEIDPNLPDAHIALGNYYYWGFLNYSKALDEIKIAEQQMTNNSECFFTEGNIYRRAGQWSKAKENYLKAFELDPGSSIIADNIGETCYLTGEYQEAEKYYNKSCILNPSFMDPYCEKSIMYMKWKGNTIQARKTIAEAYQFNEFISNKEMFELKVLTDIYDGNYQSAISTLSSKNTDIIDDQFYFHPKTLLYARVYNLMKMPDKAHEYFDSARITIESGILKDPDDPRLYSALGIAYAGLGQKEKAISAGKKALELMPINKEAYRGACRAEDLARIYVMVGKYDDALEQIKILLAVPSALSVKMLMLDPTWKPLWNLPDFKKITKSLDVLTTDTN